MIADLGRGGYPPYEGFWGFLCKANLTLKKKITAKTQRGAKNAKLGMAKTTSLSTGKGSCWWIIPWVGHGWFFRISGNSKGAAREEGRSAVVGGYIRLIVPLRPYRRRWPR